MVFFIYNRRETPLDALFPRLASVTPLESALPKIHLQPIYNEHFKNIGLKTIWNEQLRKNRGRGTPLTDRWSNICRIHIYCHRPLDQLKRYDYAQCALFPLQHPLKPRERSSGNAYAPSNS
jgi:hypothetical protein